MNLPAFTLRTEPLRRKFYRPKPVLVRSFTQSGSCIWGAGAFLAKIKFAASRLRRDLR